MESDVRLPKDTAEQWEVLICIIAFEEKKIDRRNDGALETLTYFWNHKGVRHIFTEWLQQMKFTYDKQTAEDESSQKNDSISLLWRQRGNDKFKAAAYEESFKLYSKSVAYANKESPLYSLALANRSAASWRLNNFKDCIKDIQRAMNHNYPDKCRHKLYMRRADCYFELGQRQNGIESMQSAVRHNQKVRLTGHAKVEFDKTFDALRAKLVGLNNHEVPPDKLELPKLFMGENPEFKRASAAIELKRSDTAGRYVVTKEATKRGDVLFAEEPFASVKLIEKDLPHPNYCDYCCGSEPAIISCGNCTSTYFCDEACHYLGRVLYHRWECAAIRAKIFSVIGLAHLAFRVMLKYAHRGFPKLPDSAGTPTTAARLIECYTQVDKVEIYNKDSDAFYCMFSLTSNLDTSANTDNIQYALTSTMLTIYLEQFTDFFEYFPSRVGYPLPLSEMKLLCAALIFRTLGQLIINAHTVLDLSNTQYPDIYPPNNLDPWCRVGSAIYPSISMMNHSCEPNIINLFYKNQLFVKGLHELPKGAEVLNCYGPHYAREKTDDRREKLRSQYGFNCMCAACTDNTRRDFTLLFTAYSCPSCKGPVTWEGTRMSCHQCPNEFPLQRAQNAAETAEAMHALVLTIFLSSLICSALVYCKWCHWEFKMGVIITTFDQGLAFFHSAMRAKTPEERCERMVRAYRLMQQVLYRHHNILRKAVDELARLYAATGEYAKSIDLIKQNIQSFEYQYGSFSVEVTNEIRKMTNMMVGRVMKYLENPDIEERQWMNIKEWIRETLKITRKANQLMELNYGSWQYIYKALKAKERLLEGMLDAPRFQDGANSINYRLQNLNML